MLGMVLCLMELIFYWVGKRKPNLTLCRLDWTEVKLRTKPCNKHDVEPWIKMDFCVLFKVLGSSRTPSQTLTGKFCLCLLPGPGSPERRWLRPGGGEAQQKCTKRGSVLCVLPAPIYTDSGLKKTDVSPLGLLHFAGWWPLCLEVRPRDSVHLPVYQLHLFSVPLLVFPSLPERQVLRFMLTFPCLCSPDTVHTGNRFSKD